ncbi:hypothetical protein BGX28_002132 [Mortierella sp. GBA30]|nr:hypothetical protein BGX28_002132 [Mortierella sp. GBA30]
MANPMFDDFIELDLLDPSVASNDMFSYYLGDTEGELAPAAVMLSATEPDQDPPALDADLDLAVKQEDTSDSDTHMLLDPSPEVLAAEASSSMVFTEPALTLVIPEQLTIAPQVTTVSPATISLSTVAPSDLTAPSLLSSSTDSSTKLSTSAVSGHASSPQNGVSNDSTNTHSSSPSKRPSPEPTASPRKYAKMASVSKSKTTGTSSRKSSSAAVTATAAAAASSAAESTKFGSASNPNITTSQSSAPSKSTSKSSSPTSETPTSPINTTLSAATLQFLLQQQEETPLIPQLFSGKLSREEIEATLARLLESTKHLIATPTEDDVINVKQEPVSDDESDDGMEGLVPGGEGAEQTHGLKTQPGIKTDDIPSSTDLKKMTSKERRQLRNKISARNFRVRRKEYIVTLEGQVLQHKTEARHLREAVTLVQEENLRLKDELEMVRRQLAETTLSSASAASAISTSALSCHEQAAIAVPLSKENQSLLTSIMNRNVNSALNPNAKSNLTLTMARPQSPILTPNLFKDVPNSSSGSASQNSWKDKKPIMVHTTLVPEICFGDEFQFGEKPPMSKDNEMVDRPWMKLLEQGDTQDNVENTMSTGNPFLISGLVYELMQTFAGMSMAMNMYACDFDVSVEEEQERSLYEAENEIDWDLQESLWASVQTPSDVGDELTDEQIQALYDLSQVQISSLRSLSSSPASIAGTSQEDPNMLEWLYESMMARLVDLDLQDTQERTHASLSEAHLA